MKFNSFVKNISRLLEENVPFGSKEEVMDRAKEILGQSRGVIQAIKNKYRNYPEMSLEEKLIHFVEFMQETYDPTPDNRYTYWLAEKFRDEVEKDPNSSIVQHFLTGNMLKLKDDLSYYRYYSNEKLDRSIPQIWDMSLMDLTRWAIEHPRQTPL